MLLEPTAGLMPTLPISNLAATALQLAEDGIASLLPSTRMRMATRLPVVVLQTHLLVALVMDSGVMGSIFQVHPTRVSSVSFSVLQMTQPSSKPVSTSRSTMISPSRLLDTMSLSQFSSSPTLLSMITCSRISSWPTTRFQPQSRNTLFLLSWVVVT